MEKFIKKYQILLIIIASILLNYFLFHSQENQELVEIKDILDRGNDMIKRDIIYRDCDRVSFESYPELKDKYIEAVYSKMAISSSSDSNHSITWVYPPEGKSCFKDMKLVKLEYSIETHGNYEAVFRCEKNGIGEELKVGYFQKSCSYTAFLSKWNLPVGKYTVVSQP
ncbi:hypothetical protein [Acinetobacter courvalinii]|uniref:hypothetical protein n=1 Tax=Acinetobacter courvalinii TaxID=280147 RepID=UPI001902813E|nr:hypothetical protein [Acinetobacter courvalinii]MBJ8417453.1 hypothetical protein [Acinetobacter courvalinii]